MDDVISRKQAIDALIEWYGCEPNDIDAFKEIIYNKPSAQPDVPDTNVGDMISRQAAIDAVQGIGRLATLQDNDAVVRMSAVEYVLFNLPPAQPEIIRCKDCIHFHYDFPYVIQGIPVFVHEICDFWGDGCKTSENEFCGHAERRSDDETNKGSSC